MPSYFNEFYMIAGTVKADFTFQLCVIQLG